MAPARAAASRTGSPASVGAPLPAAPRSAVLKEGRVRSNLRARGRKPRAAHLPCAAGLPPSSWRRRGSRHVTEWPRGSCRLCSRRSRRSVQPCAHARRQARTLHRTAAHMVFATRHQRRRRLPRPPARTTDPPPACSPAPRTPAQVAATSVMGRSRANSNGDGPRRSSRRCAAAGRTAKIRPASAPPRRRRDRFLLRCQFLAGAPRRSTCARHLGCFQPSTGMFPA